MLLSRAAMAVVLTFTATALADVPSTLATRAAEIDIAFQEFTLGNGLRVIIHTDRKAPVVAISVWYHVGSKDEPPGRTGFAHLFEHLMFQATEHHAGEYTAPFELVGATDQNGTTNRDRTGYFETVPTTALDLALWMESDRMGHLVGALDQAVFDQQRGVVQNEKRQTEDQPYGLANERLFAASYPEGHPYHHATLGSMTDLDAATLADAKHWFQSWYGPNNAVLVLAGDLDLATARAKVTRYFGDIPATATVPRLAPQIAPRTTTTRETVTDQVPQPRLYRVWNIPAFGTRDAERLELFAYLLGGARSSRLARRLIHEDQSVDNVEATLWSSELGSSFVIRAEVKPGRDPAAVERAIDDELRHLIADGPSDDELVRARMVSKASFVRGIERTGGPGGQADGLAQCAVFTGKPGCFRDALAVIEHATRTELQATSKQWLLRGDHVLWITPGARIPAIEPRAVAARASTRVAPADRRWHVVPSDVDRSRGVPTVTRFPALVFPALQHATLSSGLQIVLAARPGAPLVQLRLEVRGAGFASDPAHAQGTAGFAMALLDQGAGALDALAFGDRLDALGASLEAGVTLDTATVGLSVLADHLAPALALLADVLLRPRLDARALDRVRAQVLAGIAREKAAPQSLARRLMRPLMFGSGHPYAAPPDGNGTESAIAAVSRDQLVAWTRARLRPDLATLIVVGDTSLAALTAQLEAALAGWTPPAAAAPPTAIPAVTSPRRPRVFLVDQPGATQASIIVAQLVASSQDARALDFDLASAVLGGQFSSRLNMNLREDKHWSYGAYAGAGGALGPRLWTAKAAVQLDKTVDSLRELQREITQYATGVAPATADEVAKIQTSQVRSLPGSYETADAVVDAIADVVRYHHPDDWVARCAARIQAVTPADIQAAAAALQPTRLTWVIVGDLRVIEPGIRALRLGDVQVRNADGMPVR